MQTLTGHSSSVYSVGFSADGSKIVSGKIHQINTLIKKLLNKNSIFLSKKN